MRINKRSLKRELVRHVEKTTPDYWDGIADNAGIDPSHALKRRTMFTPGRIILAAAMAVILLVGIPFRQQALAAIRELIRFIPGVGVTTDTEGRVYVLDGVKSKIQDGVLDVELMNAVYGDGFLHVSLRTWDSDEDARTEGMTKEEILQSMSQPPMDSVTLYLDGTVIPQDKISRHASWSSDTVYYDFYCTLDEPRSESLYEVSIIDPAQRLSFRLTPCTDYTNLSDIGPTQTQNGIPITTVTSQTEEGILVWCYPYNTTKDRILGIGESTMPYQGKDVTLETDHGILPFVVGGMKTMGKFTFKMEEVDTSLKLHIPYLTMQRTEEKRVKVPVPKGDAPVQTDIQIPFTLGTLHIVETAREKAEGSDHMLLRLTLRLDSAEQERLFQSVNVMDTNRWGTSLYHSCSMQYSDDGFLRTVWLELEDPGSASAVYLTLSNPTYFLLGEYEIPLTLAD